MLYLLFSLFFSITSSILPPSLGYAPEPWLPINGGSFSGTSRPYSPDPLVRYIWQLNNTNDTVLQIFTLPALSIQAIPSTSFSNITSAIGSINCSIQVLGIGKLVIDFGIESPSWIEFDSFDLSSSDIPKIILGSGEYSNVNFDGTYKEDVPKVYCNTRENKELDIRINTLCTYRLETNSELYEGVRYAFLFIKSNLSSPFTISALRLVSQAKPVNYVASFSSSGDPLLEQIWYIGAYTVRAAFQGTYMGSILEDRGDRIAWTGDLHPTQLTSMITFANYKFVLENLNRTSCIDCSNGIATYALYFILSTLDYYYETGDITSFEYFIPVIVQKLAIAQELFPNPINLRFVGHDDRLGNGFCNNTTPETKRVYQFIVIRCYKEFGTALITSGINSTMGYYYLSLATNATFFIRNSTSSISSLPWYSNLYLHSATDAINADIVNNTEMSQFLSIFFNNIVTLPSHSNFQQFFILQAQAKLGAFDMAVESARIIWGAQVALGATTFWEISHPDLADILLPGPSPIPNEAGWCSLAHPWSSGITPWLSKWILGIRPLEPGYTRTLIAPHIAHTMKDVSGGIGTPHGSIILNITRAVNNLSIARLYIILPSGINEAVVRLSSILLQRILGVNTLNEKDLSTLVINGDYFPTIVYVDEAPLLDESNPVLGRAASLEFILKGGMEHTLLISTQVIGTASKWRPLESPFPPPTWPGQFIGSDYETKGNWINKYGKDGYILFGFDNNSTDTTIGRISLPSYIDRVEIFTNENSGFNDKIFTWPSLNTSQDIRALQDPQDPISLQRRLGALSPSGSGSALVDIFVNSSNPIQRFRVSAYLVDFSSTPWFDGQIYDNRSQEVYLLTGYPDLNPLTKRQTISDFQQGLWLKYEIQGNFRFRVSTIRGDYAVLSALMFDSV
jgi:alpha-L-rhamnosidase